MIVWLVNWRLVLQERRNTLLPESEGNAELRFALRKAGYVGKEYLFAKKGFDTAENELSKVCYKGLTPYNESAGVP